MNSGAYMDCRTAGPTRKAPAILALRRYLKVYSPAGSHSKKKFVPESRTSSYHEMIIDGVWAEQFVGEGVLWQAIAALRGALGDETYNQVKDSLTESSNYFRATVWVTIGTTQFTLYSLLARGGTGSIRPVLRSFGSE